jgi:SAM-dependent methyltransferase
MLMMREYEQHEASAFDKIADGIDPASLQIHLHTFTRYAVALAGHPQYEIYPDLAFKAIGDHFGGCLKGVKVLDLGAGTGEWSAVLAHLGADLTSVEISPRCVDLAERRKTVLPYVLNWDARVGSAYRLTDMFPSGSFDLVWGKAVLHHLTNNLHTIYEQVRCMLRPGGACTFTEPYNGSQALRWARERMAWAIPIDRETPGERPLTADEIADFYLTFPTASAVYFNAFEKLGRLAKLAGSVKAIDQRLPRPVMRKLASMVFMFARR